MTLSDSTRLKIIFQAGFVLSIVIDYNSSQYYRYTKVREI